MEGQFVCFLTSTLTLCGIQSDEMQFSKIEETTNQCKSSNSWNGLKRMVSKLTIFNIIGIQMTNSTSDRLYVQHIACPSLRSGVSNL